MTFDSLPAIEQPQANIMHHSARASRFSRPPPGVPPDIYFTGVG